MKVLLIGARGFVGRGVTAALTGHELVRTDRTPQSGEVVLDLASPDSIKKVLHDHRPDAIMNCAGVIARDETAMQNVSNTQNLLAAVIEVALPVKRIIITGSAAEYGTVESLPVAEDAPIKPTSIYGESKAGEVEIALKYRHEYELPVVVARLFNPIGADMNPQQLLPNVVKMAKACSKGESDEIKVGRLDAQRDYIDIRDVGLAYQTLLEANPPEAVYNVGSGKSTTTGQLIHLVMHNFSFPTNPHIIEASDTPEPMSASQADITKLTKLGWRPTYDLATTIKDICHALAN